MALSSSDQVAPSLNEIPGRYSGMPVPPASVGSISSRNQALTPTTSPVSAPIRLAPFQ